MIGCSRLSIPAMFVVVLFVSSCASFNSGSFPHFDEGPVGRQLITQDQYEKIRNKIIEKALGSDKDKK